MSNAQPRRISVKKFDDDIVVNRKEGQTEDEQIEQLVSIHGAGGVFVDGKSVAQIRKEAEQDEQVLIGSSVQPAVIKIGENEVQLGEIVAAAHTASALSVAAWNKLKEKKREALIAAEIERRIEALNINGAV